MIIKDFSYKKFKDIYIDLYPALKAYSLKYVPESISDDILHDCFTYLWQKKPELLDDPGIYAYMFRSVHNKCVNYIKGMQVRENYNNIELLKQRADWYANNMEQTVSRLYNREIGRSILKAMDKLPERCKEVFYLYLYRNLGRTDIASLLNISVRTVDAHLYKALVIVRNELSDLYREYVRK